MGAVGAGVAGCMGQPGCTRLVALRPLLDALQLQLDTGVGMVLGYTQPLLAADLTELGLFLGRAVGVVGAGAGSETVTLWAN